MSQQLTFWDIPSVTFLPESADGASRSGLPDGPTTARSGRVRAPANVSAPQGSSEDSTTSAISGPCSRISSASVALNSSLVSKLKTRFATVGSIEYTQTWKEKVTPSGRMYWAHTASERRTGDTASTGEPYPWPTTQANNTHGAYQDVQLIQQRKEAGRQQNLQDYAVMAAWLTAQTMDTLPPMDYEKRLNHPSRPGRTVSGNLREVVTIAAWMTAKASDGEFATPRTSGRPMEKSTHLQTQVVAVAAWHTCKATDGSNGGPNQTGGALPPDAAISAFPTPRANDAEKRGEVSDDARNGMPEVIQVCGWQTITVNDSKNDASPSQWRRMSNGKARQLALNCEAFQVFLPGQTPDSSTAATGKLDGYRLNPCFSAWLMGFPAEWTEAGLRASRKTAASRSPRRKKGGQ